MKRVLLFLFLAVALDRGLGSILQWLNRHNFTGDRGGNLNHALTQEPEILVLGSSRAAFHIMPSVLREKLGMSAYNAGLKGQDFLYSVMLYDLWNRRHKPPRAVVLTTDVESLTERETEVTTAQIVAPYLDESPLIREILYSSDPAKRFEYLSLTYRFNGEVISMARHLLDKPAPGFDGFTISPGTLEPTTDTGVLNALDQNATAAEQARRPQSPQKLGYLRAMAEELDKNGTRFFLLHTPLFRQDQDAHKLWMDKLKATVATLP